MLLKYTQINNLYNSYIVKLDKEYFSKVFFSFGKNVISYR